MSLATLLAGIDRERMRADVEHIANAFPYRLAGTPSGDAMARFAAARLAEAGAAGRVETTPGLVSLPGPGRLECLGAEGASLAAQTCGHSAETPAAGLVGELVDVGGGAEADYRRQPAAGRIVLADLGAAPARPEKLRLAARAGATGLVTFNWGPDDGQALPYGSVKTLWGNPEPETLHEGTVPIPCIGVSRADGLALRRRLAQGPLQVRLHAHADNGWRPVSYTLGEIAGAGADFVVAGGHQDAWVGPAATDNATGSACLFELARLFAPHRGELRRGLVFALWEGHETGTMLSSAHFVERHWDRLRAHAVAYLQIDQPGCRGARCWNSHSNTELRRFQQETDAAVLGERLRRWRRSTKIGDSSFFGLGVPMLSSLAAFDDATLRENANAAFGWWHHTEHNTLDKVDFDDLVQHLRVFANYLWGLCTSPVLPYDYAAVAEGIARRLQELAAGGMAGALAGPLERAHALHGLALRLDAAVQACNREAAQGRGDEELTEKLNEAQKRLGRLLIAIEATASDPYGHDPYGLTAQSTLLPSLHDWPAAAAMADGPGRWAHETRLLRARNRIADTLAEACAVIERALRAPGVGRAV